MYALHFIRVCVSAAYKLHNSVVNSWQFRVNVVINNSIQILNEVKIKI